MEAIIPAQNKKVYVFWVLALFIIIQPLLALPYVYYGYKTSIYSPGSSITNQWTLPAILKVIVAIFVAYALYAKIKKSQEQAQKFSIKSWFVSPSFAVLAIIIQIIALIIILVPWIRSPSPLAFFTSNTIGDTLRWIIVAAISLTSAAAIILKRLSGERRSRLFLVAFALGLINLYYWNFVFLFIFFILRGGIH